MPGGNSFGYSRLQLELMRSIRESENHIANIKALILHQPLPFPNLTQQSQMTDYLRYDTAVGMDGINRALGQVERQMMLIEDAHTRGQTEWGTGR